MGNKHANKTKFDSFDLQRLSQLTNMSDQQLSQLYQLFQKTAGRDGALTKSEFHHLAGEVGISTGNSHETDQAFRALDRDGSGKLSFEEFISALVISNPQTNFRDRISYAVDYNNPGGLHGHITPEYGREVIDSMNHYYGIDADPDEVWDSFGSSGESLSEDDFLDHLHHSSAYSEYF